MALNASSVFPRDSELLITQKSVEPLQQRLTGWCAMGGSNSRPLPCQDGESVGDVTLPCNTSFVVASGTALIGALYKHGSGQTPPLLFGGGL